MCGESAASDGDKGKALVVEREHVDFVGQGIEGEIEGVAGADVFAIFHFGTVYQHTTKLDVFLRQRAGFEKTGSPQPFVEPHGAIGFGRFHTMRDKDWNSIQFSILCMFSMNALGAVCAGENGFQTACQDG